MMNILTNTTNSNAKLSDVLTANEITLLKNKCDELLDAMRRYSDAVDYAFLHTDVITMDIASKMSVFFSQAFIKSLRNLDESGIRCYYNKFEEEMRNIVELDSTNEKVFMATEDLAEATVRMAAVFESFENL